jgi:hypothetical protein
MDVLKQNVSQQSAALDLPHTIKMRINQAQVLPLSRLLPLAISAKR